MHPDRPFEVKDVVGHEQEVESLVEKEDLPARSFIVSIEEDDDGKSDLCWNNGNSGGGCDPAKDIGSAANIALRAHQLHVPCQEKGILTKPLLTLGGDKIEVQ